MSNLKHWESYLSAGKHGIQYFPEYENRAKAVSAEVTRVVTGQEAAASILATLHSVDAKMIVCIPEVIMESINLINIIKETGITVYTKPEDIAKYAKEADAGITEMEFAVAETGSCVENSAKVEKRLCSTLTNLHIGLLKTDHVVATIADAFTVFSKTFDCGYLSFITGPSRTADIERVLTIGVHGPARMIPIFIDHVGGIA